tara:strand:- start:27299 stop:28174 length:876 start_codon:yes stop_codon:yes gene_type:complete
MLNKLILSIGRSSVLHASALLLASSSVYAFDSTQQIGAPLNINEVKLNLLYKNDFSGKDVLDFESNMVKGDKRSRTPNPAAQWIVEGWGGAAVCQGKLWVSPVPFKSCGQPIETEVKERSHMVVWHKKSYPSDVLFEFTVNHHSSDAGLTLVFFATTGKEGQDIFDISLPVRDGVYKKYNRGLAGYTVSYWSRNSWPRALKNRERETNRIRTNPQFKIIASNDSHTDKCDNCDYNVRILKVGGAITVEINGKVVNHVIDESSVHQGGYIGLRNMSGVNKVSYDDFKVWAVK